MDTDHGLPSAVTQDPARHPAEISTELTAREYELLTKHLVSLISQQASMRTTRLQHNVKLTGRSAANQIDVVWEFLTPEGMPWRVIIECRRFRTRLKMKDVHAWRSVVDDLDTPELPTLGVMVTSTGYQSGAQVVAETYGVVILLLREPTEADFAGRVTRVRVDIAFRKPVISSLRVTATEQFGEFPTGPVPVGSCGLILADGTTLPLADHLLAGELGELRDPPAPLHEVVRSFDPPAVLTLGGQRRLKVASITATVGEQVMDVPSIAVNGREGLAQVVANVLESTSLWFTDRGTFYTSDDGQNAGRSKYPAQDVVLGRPE